MSNGKITRTVFEIIPIESIPLHAVKGSKFGKRASRRRISTQPVPKRKRLKVLVVDDNEAIAVSLAKLLHRNGYQSFGANNSDDAIAAAETFAPYLVLSDVMMPGVNGVDTCMRIKNELPACRILLLSGEVSVAESLMQDSRRAGYNFELLSKPVEPRDLVAKIKTFFTGPHTPLGRNEARA